MLMLALAAVAPVPATPASETTVAAAMQVVRTYYAAVSARDYRTAFAIWHGTLSYGRFRAGYAGTRSARVTFLKPGDPEGAAGSIYVELPVRVDASLRSGARQRFVGSYTLRRVNDVDGSTAAQRRWHIESARLKQVPAGR
jgi:hypothetical protein